MRPFDYFSAPASLLTPAVVQLLAQIHEHKGRQQLFVEANRDELASLLELAKIQSTGASNRIEGIFTTDKRLEELVRQKAEPRSRSEQEIAGYRDVLQTIHESYDYIPLKPEVILQLRRDLYAFIGNGEGGHYKAADNVIAEVVGGGTEIVRFRPASAFETPDAMREICDRLNAAWDENRIDRLILIPMFVLDFLCIHPFPDGNGRMSRLLSLLLFYRAGYIVGKYISFEMLIEKSKETYYETLQTSSFHWHEGQNDYAPFVEYYLGVLVKAYGEFESRIALLTDGKLSKPDRIKKIIGSHLGKISKKELMELCPDIAKITVERTLSELVKSGFIKKVGGGPATAYIKMS